MQLLADFAAMGFRQQRQQKELMEKERAVGAATMANDLAHTMAESQPTRYLSSPS
jgi:hypothetical protein